MKGDSTLWEQAVWPRGSGGKKPGGTAEPLMTREVSVCV